MEGYIQELGQVPDEDLFPALDINNWIRFPTVREIKLECGLLRTAEDIAQETFFFLRENHNRIAGLELNEDVKRVVAAMGGRSDRVGGFGNWATTQEYYMEKEFVRRLVRIRKGKEFHMEQKPQEIEMANENVRTPEEEAIAREAIETMKNLGKGIAKEMPAG